MWTFLSRKQTEEAHHLSDGRNQSTEKFKKKSFHKLILFKEIFVLYINYVMFIKSYHVKHRKDFSDKLSKAKLIADYAVTNKSNRKIIKFITHQSALVGQSTDLFKSNY